eukprot:SAG31_NODE_146_length_22601_cov_56.529192_14_plen_53_part_00
MVMTGFAIGTGKRSSSFNLMLAVGPPSGAPPGITNFGHFAYVFFHVVVVSDE